MPNFLTRSQVQPRFEGKWVAIVGSGPGVMDNSPGAIDDYEVVVRVNNYRLLGPMTGRRTDVFYSFFGTSIHKTPIAAQGDGVKLCMCKCPNAQPIVSQWHTDNNKMEGVDFRSIYRRRANWWFGDVYIPTVDEFLFGYNLLNCHIPTTGFAAILDILSLRPRGIYLTGFDFFRSGRHNVDHSWKPKNTGDPICHVPEQERVWIAAHMDKCPITVDPALKRALETTI